MTELDRPRTAEVGLDRPENTVDAGRDMAGRLRAAGLDRAIIFLVGDLGSGKTTLVRGFLRALGHSGRVPSPTYTLIEPYEIGQLTVYHVDLYRLANPRDADDLGLTELPGAGVVMLVEWPGQAGARLPPVDLTVTLELAGEGRKMRLQAATPAGDNLLPLNN
jgi:tRNA threonylcarbamoyladenosine biosynthesis protein TsaE